MISGRWQHYIEAFWYAWRVKVAADLGRRAGIRGCDSVDVEGSRQLLNSSHVREMDKALLRAVLAGGVWSGLLLR